MESILKRFYLHLINNPGFIPNDQFFHDFVNKYEVKKATKEKKTKTNKKNSSSMTNNNAETSESDIISELVNLANGTDYGTIAPSSPMISNEAPGAPIKEKVKRTYVRKPKIQNINEELQKESQDTNETLSLKKEKKPRKSKAVKEPVSENNVINDCQPPNIETVEKPVKEKKPRKSNKKSEVSAVEEKLEGTEINL